jgi:hypothetical protein
MIEASMAQTLEKLVITLSYSDQPFASLLAAVFCGNRRLWIFFGDYPLDTRTAKA